MFIRVKKRKLKTDVALDVMLLESSWNKITKTSKQRFLKQWTKRKSDISTSDWRKWFLEEIEIDLTYLCSKSDMKKLLSSIRKKLR